MIDGVAALERARTFTNLQTGRALAHVYEAYGEPPVQDSHRSGLRSAMTCWNASEHQVPDDEYPPVGVPVFFGPGGRGIGAVGISSGRGRVVLLGTYSGRPVAELPITEAVGALGLPFLGWTRDFVGHTVRTPGM